MKTMIRFHLWLFSASAQRLSALSNNADASDCTLFSFFWHSFNSESNFCLLLSASLSFVGFFLVLQKDRIPLSWLLAGLEQFLADWDVMKFTFHVLHPTRDAKEHLWTASILALTHLGLKLRLCHHFCCQMGYLWLRKWTKSELQISTTQSTPFSFGKSTFRICGWARN